MIKIIPFRFFGGYTGCRSRNLLLVVSVSGIALLLTACSRRQEFHTSIDSVTRNFQKIIEIEGRKLLAVEVEYIGKSPGDTLKYTNNHDYKSIDTDFYRIKLENLSEFRIEMEKVGYRLEKGRLRVKSYADKKSIEKTWGKSYIDSGGHIERLNNMVWSDYSENIFYKNYEFTLIQTDEEYIEFSVEIPLRYIR